MCAGTLLGAVDWGFRVILVTDALCSSADETHDPMMNIHMNRFGQQVEYRHHETLLETGRTSARGGKAHELTGTFLVQILLPKETGNGEPVGNTGLMAPEELAATFGGAAALSEAGSRGCGKAVAKQSGTISL